MQTELLQALLDRLSIPDWDVLIIGDGSGTGWDDACAFASVLCDRATRGRKTFWGGNRYGSVNQAEMEAYLKPLLWFEERFGRERRKQGPINVHVVTDSEVTVKHGRQSARPADPLPDTANRPLWAGMRELARMGYVITYHWTPRKTTGLNVLSDLIAGLTRRAIMALETPRGPDDDPLSNLAPRLRDAIANLDVEVQDGTPYLINPDFDPNAAHHPHQGQR